MKAAILLFALMLAGCAAQAEKLDQPAQLLPVGAGTQDIFAMQEPAQTQEFPRMPTKSLWSDRSAQMFRDRRAVAPGDIVTVLIDIDDRAALSSLSSRSRNGSATLGLDGSIDVFGLTGEGNAALNASGQSKSAGEGSVRRSEQIQLSVAAIVSGVLPNGNLFISGLQEIRVSNEKRSLGVQGIIRPKDISAQNTVRYDQMAEARVSYGGGGRIAAIQQPTVIHQIYDQVTPF
ncbi:MAG: flagellar basal body L-ring protein FlgH [Notoacmeibacter sp.]